MREWSPLKDRSARIPDGLEELTSLRFFAALAVVMFHIFYYPGSQPTFLNNLVSKGYIGVDLFFVLSGFILMHVYHDDIERKRFSYRAFLVKRFARVYPLHIAMTGVFILMYVSAALAGLTQAATGMDWSDLPWHILALHAWGLTDGHSWNFPSWSISAEAFAYLFFPVFVAATTLARPWTALAGALLAFFAAYALAHAGGHRLTALMYNFGIVRITFEFLIGVSMYRVFGTVHLRRPGMIALAVSAGSLAVAGLGASDVLLVPLLCLLIFALACCASAGGKSFMAGRQLVYLGEISYSTYMVHYLVLLIMEKSELRSVIGFTAFVVLAMILIYTLSALSYHLWEQPMRRHVQRRGRKWVSPQSPEASSIVEPPLAR